MALDRQTIEKKDFPIGRRGYEPEAVDAHLAAIADELDALRRQMQRRSGDSLASAASAQVQAIVQAAESSASDIERQAEEEAAEIRQGAQSDADRTRRDAVERSQQHVGKVSEATNLMLQRVEAMESELTALTESLRTGANRLTADLSLLEGNMGELYAAAGRTEAAADDVARASAPREAGPPPAAPVADDAGDLEPEPAIAGPAAGAAPPPGDEGAGNGAYEVEQPETADEDVEGARLIALNMALNGQSREETDRYLAENFDLRDRGGLLDEVYASVEG